MDRIGGYLITGVLGEGGMSIVYSASDPTGTPVAIKVLRPEVYGDHARRRFILEIAAVHALRHPSLPRVHKWGELPDGGLYYVMESLEGEDLEARLLRTGALDPEEVARIGIAVARGLDVAHRAGLVHRDVKPGNVFLARDGTVRILDFGLAIGLDPRLGARLTSANMLLGTPSYMAIEQATGARDEDPRTDVWALGATLYHAVSGRTPFDAPTPMGELVRIVTDEPDPLPDSVPTWLAAAIERCLVKHRESRWPSMGALAEALGSDEEAQGYLAPLLHASYGSVLVGLGRRDEARPHGERALALRDDAGGMLEGDAEIFLVANDVGIPGALARGWRELDACARGIGDPALERSFLENVPAHARLVALARGAGLCDDGKRTE